LNADELLDRLRVAYPSFAAIDDEEVTERDGEPVPQYVRVGRLPFHLADLAGHRVARLRFSFAK
jgi:hypothetical protein